MDTTSSIMISFQFITYDYLHELYITTEEKNTWYDQRVYQRKNIYADKYSKPVK